MTDFTVKLQPPKVPNYIMTERPDVKIHVSELTSDQVDEIAEQWRADLQDAAKKPTPAIVTTR